MTLVAVKDPGVLAELNGGAVTDPAILAQLNGGSVAANLSKIDAQNDAEKFTEPSTFEYLFNRIKKGAAGFLGMPGSLYESAKPTSKNIRDNASNQNVAMPPEMRAALLRIADEKDAAGHATSYAGRVAEHPIATTDDYKGVFGYDQNMKTGSDLKRYAGGVAEMAGAGGPFALAAKPAALLPLAAGTAGSGIGMEAGGDIAHGTGLSREAGEAVGALAGGVSSAVAPNALTAVGGAIKRRFSPSAQKASAESAAGREITQQMDTYPPARDNIDRSLQISEEIPGFNPSLPARSGAPGLIAEEKRLISQNPNTLNKAVQNIEENDKAVAAFVDSKFPAGTGETAAQRVKKLGSMHEERLAQIRTTIDEKLDDAVRVFEANPSNYENGQRLRELFQKQKEAYAGTRSQKYQAVYDAADNAGLRVKIDDAIQYAGDVVANEMNAYQQADIPSVFRALAKKSGKSAPDDVKAFVAKHTDAPKTPEEVAAHLSAVKTEAAKPKTPSDISFAELHSLYKRTNGDLASLRGSMRPDKDFQIHLLEGLKSKLTEKIRGFEGDQFGDVAAKLKEANRFYAEEYVPRFKQGFGSDIAAKYPSGEFRTPDQLVTELITKRPNNTQAAKDFKALFDEVPEAWGALRAGYLDELYRGGGLIDKSGRINQKSLDTFLRKHEPTLAEFPQIKGELKQLATDNSALLERRAAVVATEKKLAADDLYKLFQGRDPTVVLSEATTNPNAMRVLAFQARHDQEMAKSLGRGVAEHVTMQADPSAYLSANEKAIRIALKPLGEEHFKNLQTAVEALTINSRNPAALSVNAASVTPDNIAANFGSSPRAIISAISSIERGRTGVAQETGTFVGRWFDKLRREHKAAAMEGVFYSKDAAKAIADLARNPASDKAKLDFVTQMTALGVRAEVAGQE